MTRLRTSRVAVPPSLRGDEHFDDYHYASAFELRDPAARTRTPEEWARAVFERAAAPLHPVLIPAWRYTLGLRLAPKSSPTHVLGWDILDATQETITLGAPSSLLTARHVISLDDSTVVWTTFVRYDRPAARPLWTAAKQAHHATIPHLLKRAAHT